MNLWIYDERLERVGVMDDYTSLIWSRRYNEIGDCEVYVGANERNLSLFKKGYFIIRDINDPDDMICRIESIELDTDAENGNFLIVTAYDCRKILNQRIVWTQTNFNGTVENFIRKIINENVINPSLQGRKISNFTLGSTQGFFDTIEIQSTYDYIFDKIKELCTSYGYGSKVTFDGDNFVFNLYKGIDRSYDQDIVNPVVFSPEFENVVTTKYKSDSSQIKTTALVAGEGEGLDRVLEEVGTDVGINRYELFVDGKDVSSQIPYEDLIVKYPNGTIVEENYIVYYVVNNVKIAILDHITNPTSGKLLGQPYQILLHQKGEEQLAEKKPIVSFDGQVEPSYSYQFGEDYFLGDIVTVKNEYGIEADARVVEVIESDDENGYSLIPTFEYTGSDGEIVTKVYLLTEDYERILTETYDYILV